NDPLAKGPDGALRARDPLAKRLDGTLGGSPMFQNFDGLQKLAKVNMDASMKSFDLMTKNIQTIATEMTDYTKRSVENSTKALEKMVGAKSIDQIVQVQSEYAKAAYEDYFAEATKLGKLCADLGTEAFRPYEGLTSKAITT